MIRAGKTFVQAVKNWQEDNVLKHSAAVSFYTLFSLAPVTIIALTLAGVFLGRERATVEIQRQLSQLVGSASAELIQSAADASNRSGATAIATVTSIALLLFGATTVFGQLQESMNQIWAVRTKPERSGWLILILQRLVSFAMVLTVGFLLLVSLLLSTLLTSALQHFGSQYLGTELLLKGADLAINYAVISVLFALLFKILPEVVLRWRDVWPSAFITAALFTVGRYLIALYLAHSTVASIYGAAGSLVALLIWVYYSCTILFFGVELVRTHRQVRHLPVIPKDTAVRVRAEIVKPRLRPETDRA